jgi:hypothetical protein
MTTPIEKAMDAIEWAPVKLEFFDSDNELPYVTHSGVLSIGGFKIRVHQLSNGMRVIEEGDLAELLGIDI